MNKKFCPKVFCFFVATVVLFAMTSLSAFAASQSSSGAADVTLEEPEIDSYDELVDLLAEMGVENPESVLAEDGDVPIIQACKNVTFNPTSIVAIKPFRFKVYQIIINVSIGDCGMILCSQMGFEMTWEPGPSQGSVLIGPFPSEPIGQICQGNSTSTKGILILKKDVPNGSYKIKVKVGGFGSADYYYLAVTVQ
jgi:hypothetical protein